MKRLETIANDLIELAENVEEWKKYVDRVKNPEEDEKLQAIINDRNELITKLLLLDLETRFKYSERPSKAQAKWFKDNWGISESTLEFYRNRKSKSIAKQYSELENKDNSICDEKEEAAKEVLIDEPSIVKPDDIDSQQIEKETTSKKSGLDRKLEALNKRTVDDSIWSRVTLENLCLLEPQYHTPYEYGDILEDGRVYVWKGRYTDKETFYKSYVKSKEFLDKKNELGLSVSDIIKKTGLPRHTVNNALYYPYIKTDEMMVEQFERKYKKIKERSN